MQVDLPRAEQKVRPKTLSEHAEQLVGSPEHREIEVLVPIGATDGAEIRGSEKPDVCFPEGTGVETDDRYDGWLSMTDEFSEMDDPRMPN